METTPRTLNAKPGRPKPVCGRMFHYPVCSDASATEFFLGDYIRNDGMICYDRDNALASFPGRTVSSPQIQQLCKEFDLHRENSGTQRMGAKPYSRGLRVEVGFVF